MAIIKEGAVTPQSQPVSPPEPGGPVVRWWEPLVLWLLATLVLLTFVPNLLDKLNPPTGDEPFYLMTAISLLHDHDLDESNNYAQRDYWEFAPTCDQMNKPHFGLVGDKPVYNVSGVFAPGMRGDCPGQIGQFVAHYFAYLPPHNSKGVRQEGLYTKHGIGLSVLIAPAYAIGGRPLVVVWIVVLTALLGVNLWLLAFETTGRKGIAWLTWLMMLFSAPLLCFAFLIFPATPAGLFVVYAWRRLRLSARAQQFGLPDWQPNGPLRALAIGGCIGLLPWLHSLYLLLSAMLLLYWLGGGRLGEWLRQKPRRIQWRKILPAGWSPLALAGLFVPLILLGFLFLAYYLYLYGSPMPNVQDHAGFAPPYLIPVGGLGLLFDQKYGLLIYAPFYLLALVGLWLMGRKLADKEETAARRSDLAWLFVTATPYLLAIADYNQWWGEWCPPARYLVPTLPLLAVPLSLALAELSGRFFKIFTGVTFAWSLTVAAIFMYNPHLMYNWQNDKPATFLLWLEANLPFMDAANLGRFVPYYVAVLKINDGEPSWLAAGIWFLLAAGLFWLLARAWRDHFKPVEEAAA